MKKRVLLIVTFICVLFAAILTACGEEPIKYELSVDGGTGGQIRLTVIEAAEGERVTVNFEPDEGWAFKEGSMRVNGVLTEGTSFIMPAENVVVSGEFVLADYKGTYIYYSYFAEPSGHIYEFIDLGESTLSVGYTLATYADNFDYVIYEDIPYEVADYKITATVNDEAWSAEIGSGTLFHGAYEYELAENIPLGGTYTEIQEQNGRFECDYTFTDGALRITTYFENGTSETENATYKQFGSFVYIELPDSIYSATNRIEYGVLRERGDSLVFLYNYHYHGGDEGVPSVMSNTLNLYPKSEEEITLKEDGAYILSESINPYNGSEWDIECHDFIAIKDGKLAFSRHGTSYNGSLHYFGEDTQYERFGNLLKISYSLDENDFVLIFHIVDENTVLIKSTLNTVQKFAFVKNDPFTGGHGEYLSALDSDIYEVRYYEDGEFRDKWFDKQTDFLVNTYERGTYHVYGNLLVCVWDSASMNFYIGTIEAQTDETSKGDYLYHYKVIEWNNICEERVSTVRIWKEAT